ncbi:MAG: bifunctional phosphopantothenoylcysteine decarboxylase/phosphopantothenate--cysteine ligase CoaBC [Prolixibacteraceae bacterium]|nr:bifunctional phosphopantothenoylcysteine decarboxylase/phosphopantothenate--cysteine ligase CoaBC [Prolixibacteraceae bacterium]
MKLQGKHILLGISGSIAAYKAAFLVRLLVKEGAEVQVIMTPASKEFITPVTMCALSGKPVASEFFVANDGTWHSHVDMGLWADLLLVAPATASTIAKMATGVCDNLLITTVLSAKCPVMVAPAMDLDMYRYPANQKNLQTLKSYGQIILEPGEGELASGLSGKGRMQEPEEIISKVISFFSSPKKLYNKSFLVTAGPTYEKIDPVRYIGNRSSGKMGFAIAQSLAEEGASVTLVSGPVNLEISHPFIKIIKVESAREMEAECLKIFPDTDGAVMCAAVFDFRVENISEKRKIKRTSDGFSLSLIPNDDIASRLGSIKTENQLLVGFALETDHEMENAKEKLNKKNLDFIVLNSLTDKGACFGFDTNKISVLSDNGSIINYPLKDKKEVAKDIVALITERLKSKV